MRGWYCGSRESRCGPMTSVRRLRERRLVSVANLTRADAVEFLALAPRAGVAAEVETFPLAEANLALGLMRVGRRTGAAVLIP